MGRFEMWAQKIINLRMILLSLITLFAIFQFYRPVIPSPPITQDFDGPEDIKQILKESCYDCHSNETKLSWFDQINPGYLIVRNHIIKGRYFLNLSNWDKLNETQKRTVLFDSLNVVKTFKTMPLPEYTLLHPKAKLTQDEIEELEKYVLSLEREVAIKDFNSQDKSGKKLNFSEVKDAPNGIRFIRDYKNWQVISITERFDHNSIRIIYANDIAINAIKNGKNIPYPDGTILVKEAWERAKDTAGNIVPGKFIQVEFMIKNKRKYASTKGWGWARWLGYDLEPFGKDATFSNFCVNCHKPVRANDYTFTPPINFSMDTGSRRYKFGSKSYLNDNAAVKVKNIPFNFSFAKVVSVIVRPTVRQMVLVLSEGKSQAPRTSDFNQTDPQQKKKWLVIYWQQKDDPVWIGARIPGKFLFADLVQFNQEAFTITRYDSSGQALRLNQDEKEGTSGLVLRLRDNNFE